MSLRYSTEPYTGILEAIENTKKIQNQYDRKIRNRQFCIYFVFISYLFCIFKGFRTIFVFWLRTFFFVFISYFELFSSFRDKAGVEYSPQEL